MMATVRLPLRQAEQWPWLVNALVAAQPDPTRNPHSFTEGAYVVYELPDLAPGKARTLAEEQLKARQITAARVAARRSEVSVIVSSWLIPLGAGHDAGQHAYERAMADLCQSLAADPLWEAWLRPSGYTAVEFHQGPNLPEAVWQWHNVTRERHKTHRTVTGYVGVDLRIKDYPLVSRLDADRQARQNLRRILLEFARLHGLASALPRPLTE